MPFIPQIILMTWTRFPTAASCQSNDVVAFPPNHFEQGALYVVACRQPKQLEHGLSGSRWARTIRVKIAYPKDDHTAMEIPVAATRFWIITMRGSAMRMIIFSLCLFMAALPALATENMQGKVLFIRHALAPGMGDPDNFKVEDCSTQRNLDDRGREQARNIGAFLRKNIDKWAEPVLTSQWCRCIETAELMNIGPVDEFMGLNSFFTKPGKKGVYLNALEAKLESLPRDGTVGGEYAHHTGSPSRNAPAPGVGSGQKMLYDFATAQSRGVWGYPGYQ
jgi:Phosphohistidine phosphatase SixA